jgi:pyruvate/2-oxoglutarate dehydrogenase complex dihydrolipoamide acyltransferase (E2) component
MSSTAECIHGFEPGLCAICSPAPEPTRPRAARPEPAPRRATPVRTAARASVTPAQQRVYHVTHLANLPAIVRDGLVAGAEPELDVSSALTRELRREAEIAHGEPVATAVPFYLAPDADRWVALRDGAADPAWSDAARRAAATDFVFLITTLDRLHDAALSDGDAAGSLTRFARGEQLPRMLVRLHDADARTSAEALAPGSVPWSSIQLVGVANERVRDRARALTSTKVAVYPPWFVA